MESFKLRDLLIDIDYQEKFTYEQRVDYFNKYGYSTAMLFFTPAYHLSNYIISFLGYSPDNRWGFGHGKCILDTKLLETATDYIGKPTSYFQYKQMSTQEYLKSGTAFYTGRSKTSIKYWLKDEEELVIKLVDGDFRIPRVDIYEKIEEWLKDFKYK